MASRVEAQLQIRSRQPPWLQRSLSTGDEPPLGRRVAPRIALRGLRPTPRPVPDALAGVRRPRALAAPKRGRAFRLGCYLAGFFSAGFLAGPFAAPLAGAFAAALAVAFAPA